MMSTRRDTITLIIGGVALAAVVAFFGATHYRAFFPTTPVASDEPVSQATLTIPTIDEMCAGLGATQGDALKQCQTDESAAGEFVIAWMGLNGFIADGAISIDQIQLLASLDSDPLGLDSSAGADPALSGDPSLGLDALSDPSVTDPVFGNLGDPFATDTSSTFSSAAELALFCLGQSQDWLRMHDCISENDPSRRFSGGE